MAFAHVHSSSLVNLGAVSSAPITVPATTQGNVVCGGIWLSNTTRTATVTDNAGNTYVVSSTSLLFNASANKLLLFYGVQLVGGATLVTVTLSGASNVQALADEFSGAAASNGALLAAVSAATNPETASGTGTALALSTALQPTASGRLIYVIGGAPVASPPSWTAGSGYAVGQAAGAQALASEYKLAGTTSETAPFTASKSVNWGLMGLVIAPPGATPVGPRAGSRLLLGVGR